MPFKCITANLSWTPFSRDVLGEDFTGTPLQNLKLGGGLLFESDSELDFDHGSGYMAIFWREKCLTTLIS